MVALLIILLVGYITYNGYITAVVQHSNEGRCMYTEWETLLCKSSLSHRRK